MKYLFNITFVVFIMTTLSLTAQSKKENTPTGIITMSEEVDFLFDLTALKDKQGKIVAFSDDLGVVQKNITIGSHKIATSNITTKKCIARVKRVTKNINNKTIVSYKTLQLYDLVEEDLVLTSK